eukprot:jgi/Tetstr1/442467/TSEL_003213.t1
MPGDVTAARASRLPGGLPALPAARLQPRSGSPQITSTLARGKTGELAGGQVARGRLLAVRSSSPRGAQGNAQWSDNRLGGMDADMGMDELLVWRFWREWGGNKYCRAMINGAPTRASGGKNYVYRVPALMEERLLALRRLLVSDEAMTPLMLESIMRVPIKEPRVLAMSPTEMARRIVELRLMTQENVVGIIIRDPRVLVADTEELAQLDDRLASK